MTRRTQPSEPERARAGTLQRKFGALDGAALVISNVVGIGIFIVPGIAAGKVPGPLPFLGLWLVGGALALIGALSYAELAALRPRAGGEYIYIGEAFGPLAGFLSGWTSFVAGFSGALAATAMGFAEYLGRFLPAAAETRTLLAIPLGFRSAEISPRTLVALGVIGLFTLVHLSGVRPGRLTQNGLAGLNVLTIALLVVAGFAFGTGTYTPVASVAAQPSQGNWLLALILVMFTYSGWNAAAYIGGEIRKPGRNIPRALSIGTGVVIVLYLLLNGLYLYALAPARLSGTVAVGDAAAEALFGAVGTAIFTPLVLLALASSVSAMIVAGPRIYYAMAHDGCLPRVFGRLQRASGVPAFATIAQSVWSGVLVVSGTFEALLTYTGFAVVLFAGAAVTALFVFRRRYPDAPRPYKVWGYPVAPAAFVLLSLAMVVHAVRTAPLPSLAGLGIIAAGIPVYFIMICRRR